MFKDLYRDTYRTSSIRLQEWDYAQNAAYFITICTKQKFPYFGSCNEGEVILSDKGKLAVLYWNQITVHFPFIQLGEYCCMPNHMHGIIIINKSDDDSKTRQCLVSTEKMGEKRFQNQGKQTVSSIVGSYKSIVTKQCRMIDGDFNWQAGFYEHIIRNEVSLSKISDYIVNNPLYWNDDEYFS